MFPISANLKQSPRLFDLCGGETTNNFKKLFCLTPRKKATGFGGSYREIIMKKFYHSKLGGL